MGLGVTRSRCLFRSVGRARHEFHSPTPHQAVAYDRISRCPRTRSPTQAGSQIARGRAWTSLPSGFRNPFILWLPTVKLPPQLRLMRVALDAITRGTIGSRHPRLHPSQVQVLQSFPVPFHTRIRTRLVPTPVPQATDQRAHERLSARSPTPGICPPVPVVRRLRTHPRPRR